MKKVAAIVICLLLAGTVVFSQTGFNSTSALSTFPIASSTGEVPQSKVWTYAGKHWTVLATSSGTSIFRLDGNTWTNAFNFASGSTAKADIKVVGSVVHVLIWKGTSSYLYSMEYVPATNNYKMWTVRSARSAVTLQSKVKSATIDIDGTGRMWLASDGTGTMTVQWSDYPYTTWNGPFTISNGSTDADLSTVIAIPGSGKIGVFWSNKNTKLFGFKIHNDGDSPTTWSADETPGSGSAVNIGSGFADSRINLKAAQDGKVYAAVKTGYSTNGYPQILLLVRNNAGSWSNAYTITENEGTDPIVVINESLNKIKVIYCLPGGISYKESSLSTIAFGQAISLISGSYSNPSSTKDNYTSEEVILASDASNVVGVLGVDASMPPTDVTPPTVSSINRFFPESNPTNSSSLIFRVTFSEIVTGVDVSDFALTKSQSANGLIASVNAVSGLVYDITVNSVTGNGTIRLDLKASGTGIADLATNSISGGYTSGQTFTIQQAAPSLTSVSISSNNAISTFAKPGNTVTLSFTASTAINISSLSIAGNAVTPSVSGLNAYSASYVMTNSAVEGIIPFSITFNATDGTPGGTVTTTTNGSSVTLDKTSPTVIYINRQSPTSSTTSAVSVIYRIGFSEPVTGVDASDFVLTTTGATVGTIASVVQNAVDNYDITVNAISGSGTIRLDLKNSGTGINDFPGNGIIGGFVNGQVYTIDQNTSQPGFTSIIPLSNIELTKSTEDKPQAKVWKYYNQWWCVLSVTGGTKIFRLDGTTWTSVLTLLNKVSQPDCIVVGNLVHILALKGSGTSYFYTVEFDPLLNTYKLWNQRPTSTNITFPSGTESATLAVDGTGRLWAAAAGTTSAYVWWSDAPYNSWSSAITLVSGIKDDDICSLVTFPNQGKIGLFWSNQTTKRFGFKTHTDGASPSTWSAEESPAAQSAIDNVGGGFSDDHLNLKVSSDGTLYAAVKTSYDKNGFPKLMLLVRRPNGTWDDAYPFAMNPEGTRPCVIINEALGKIKVVYTEVEAGGNILYRESSMSNISFGPAMTLISSPGLVFNEVTSTHQNYTSDIVLMATDETSNPERAFSVLATDGGGSGSLLISQANSSVIKLSEIPYSGSDDIEMNVNPNPIAYSSQLNFVLPYSSAYSVNMFNNIGMKEVLIKQGKAEAGVRNSIPLNTTGLASGLYIINILTEKGSKSVKVMIQK